jgi:hypothetical protein
MPRGARRPGAGAPKGNWNALTTGLRSKRLQDLVLSLRDDPQFVAVYRLIVEPPPEEAPPRAQRSVCSGEDGSQALSRGYLSLTA